MLQVLNEPVAIQVLSECWLRSRKAGPVAFSVRAMAAS
jgi:hypothetical protein